ncbi:CopG family ribbon-helix-helix protein [Thermosphaera chiliense]|uniref:CopG family ribbon-helix-helix protein n=1 Tax=Thermosphaera chiliense TaxID=3402707 RepID=A0A7M1UP82_9CREN|nr:CopG family ribbon-helix-helix protein [Thermosphaera aggregans]QOR94021.1 CopG family ribbon-helix-helix protein [Thermosphaera aggregans]
MKGVKIGVYIPADIYEEIAKFSSKGENVSLSKLVQEALRLYMYLNQPLKEGAVVGTINVVYDHGKKNIDSELTDLQHEFLEIVVSTLHVHLDEETCMLNIIVKGEGKRVSEFIDNLRMLKGVLLVNPTLYKMKG